MSVLLIMLDWFLVNTKILDICLCYIHLLLLPITGWDLKQ